MRIDPAVVRQQISNIALAHPELVDDVEAWSDTLASQTELDELLTTLLKSIDDAEALIVGTASRLEELHSRKHRFAMRVEATCKLIQKLMEAADIRKRELPLATVSLRHVPPKVIGELDGDKLPDPLVTIERKPNRAAIKKALEAGEEVAGASLSNGSETISIRVK